MSALLSLINQQKSQEKEKEDLRERATQIVELPSEAAFCATHDDIGKEFAPDSVITIQTNNQIQNIENGSVIAFDRGDKGTGTDCYFV